MQKYFYYRTYDDGTDKAVYRMFVTPNGITIDFKNGKMLDTGIVPSIHHPGKSKLLPEDIENFHRYIKYKNYEVGRLYSKKEYDNIKKKYQKWRKEN